MPLLLTMKDIDVEIRRWYREETRTRIIGYDETTEQPITEEYTEIVLDEPPVVTYEDVQQRRGERKSDKVVRAEIANAILREDFEVNHNGYLAWKSAHEYWVENQPTEIVIDEKGDPIEQLLPEPERPTIDMQNRRNVYFNQVTPYDLNYVTVTGEFTTVYDDEDFIAHITFTTVPRSDEEIAGRLQSFAKQHREEMKLSNILVHGHMWQVGQEDRNNMDETIAFAYRNDCLDQQVAWITADNEVVMLTYHQLSAIKDAYTLRMAALFEQYGVWRAGDKLTPFKYEEGA